jgi:hypothetical protein
MNLFVAGWNVPKERHAAAIAGLRRMIDVFPQLDASTLWQRSSAGGTVFAASMHTAGPAAAPRRYVWHAGDRSVFYCGLPVAADGAFAAHCADDLAARWDHLADHLEGQYAALRIVDEPPRLELITDTLGMEQVFYSHQGDSWLVSNSVRLLERIGGPRPLDELGVSLYLGIGWAGDDRTLRDGIRVIPGGQHWTWQAGDVEPRRRICFGPTDLARQPRRALNAARVERLANDLMQLCRSLGQSFPLESPLTGGRDSRLLAALLIRAGVSARYVTAGEPSSADAQIGAAIAQAFDLPHTIVTITEADVVNRWDDLAWSYVRQNDGLSSLWEIASVLELAPHVERLKVGLWGIGGEIARGFYGEPRLYLNGRDVASVQRYLVEKKVADAGGLVRREATALARDYVHRFVRECVAMGFAPVDAPDVFYAFQRVGRWGGNNARRVMPIQDLFTPFSSRAFVSAAFALPASQRYTEPLHYSLMRRLSPELHRLPFDGKPWRAQQPWFNLLKVQGVALWRRVQRRSGSRSSSKRSPDKPAAFDRGGWFEGKRQQALSVCLDQVDSPLWNFVDRSVFERLMSSATEPDRRWRYRSALYGIATLFYYEADHHRQHHIQGET